MMARRTIYTPAKEGLFLYILGRFRLERDGKPIHLPTRKIESLLAYLVLFPQPHTREKLAALLWGDVGTQQAYISLRTAVYQCKRLLGTAVLVVDRETIQLNPSLVLWVDAREILEIRLPFSDWNDESIRKLRSKIEYYQGDLLADFYDDWIGPERERYRIHYLEALLGLTRVLRSRSEYKEAIEVARRMLVYDSGNEQAHQQLMFCYVASGNRSEALEQYQRCRQALEEEYGVEPSSETAALAEWIRQSPRESRSLEARITNLPIPVSSFIGRKREVQELIRLLSSGQDVRLLTLTGAGGSGKTRLAIRVGMDLIDHFDDGVWWVDLAGLADEAQVPQAVAKALGIREASHQSLLESITDVLHPQKLLIILDNCEHLLASCAHLVTDLLEACPSLQVLATSREAIRVTGERLYPVPALDAPQTDSMSLTDLLMQFDAIRMFSERATAIQPEFAVTEGNASAIIRICQRLDGIPLALELAAARLKHLSVEQIAVHLDNRFELLNIGNRTALPRQQTLRAAIDWSYDLLSLEEKSLFCRLAVFSSSFTLEAAEAITADNLDLLARLVDKSLLDITVVDSGSARYGMLETIQQYAFLKLNETGETDSIAERHSDYYLSLAQTTEQNLHGPDQVQWLNLMEAEQKNMQSALRWAIQYNVEAAMTLAVALYWFWERRSYFSEGVTWLEGILNSKKLKDANAAPQLLKLHAKTLWAAGSLIAQLGDNRTAIARLQSSAALFRGLLQKEIYEEKPETKKELALVLTHLSQALRPLGHYKQARVLGEEAVSLFRGIGDDWGLAFSLSQLAYIVRDQDGYAAAHLSFEESLDLYRRTGDLRGIGDVLSSLGITAHLEGNDRQAEKWLEESLELGRRVGDRYQIGVCLVELAFVAMAHGDDARADLLTRESLSLFRALGHIQGIANTFVARAALACHQSHYDRAARLYGAIDALTETAGGIIIQRRKEGYVELTEKVRDVLGSSVFETEYALGKLLSADDTLKTALW